MNIIEKELSLALQADNQSHHRKSGYLHASAVGLCLRQQYYTLTSHEALPPDSHFLSICDIGHGVHRQLQDRLVRMGWVKPDNVERFLSDETEKVCGSCDALSEPLEAIGGRRAIIDIKTITARDRLEMAQDQETGVIHKTEVIPGSWQSLTKPKKEHLLQVTLYAWMAKRMELVEEMPSLMVIYVGKDVAHDIYPDKNQLSVPYKVFTEDVQQEVLDEALKRVRYIWGKIEKGQVPRKEYYHKPERPHWRCETCSFRHHCYKEEGYFKDAEALLQI